ncbi:MAG: xanthine dehydrogenase family protein subunit M [Halanaerobium sp.]|nr:xanthine dehydrogenase family protein subunit M [Halanaerobium sp.]
MIRPFNYFKASSVEEALELLNSQQGQTNLLAGGTDLMADLRKGIHAVDNVIDIKGIPKLAKIELKEEGLFLGATVTCNQLMEDRLVQEHAPLLVEAAGHVASHQIRNRATPVGNLCTASPGADMAPSLLVLGTTVKVKGREGTRDIPLPEFFVGVKKNALQQGELVLGLQVALHPPTARGRYLKKARIKGPDLSSAGVAGFVSPDESMVSFAYGALAPTPRLIDASAIFSGTGSLEDKIASLLGRVDEVISPITDVRSTKEYRMRIARIYTARICLELWKGARQE